MDDATSATADGSGEPSGDGSGAASGGADPGVDTGPGDGAAEAEDRRRAVQVLGDRVLVALPGQGERTTRTGLLIPATADSVDRKGRWGEVLTVGPHVRTIMATDDVLYLPEDAIEVDVRGDAYLIVRERDIHAVASTRTDARTGLYL